MTNFFKSTLAGLGLAAAMLMPSAMADERDITIRLHMQQPWGVEDRPAMGKYYYQILDQCEESVTTCVKYVQIIARVEKANG